MKKLTGIAVSLAFAVVILCGFAYTTLASVNIINSVINSTAIGATTPSSGAFTTLSNTTGGGTIYDAFVGNLTGNVTGTLTGNVIGNVSGNAGGNAATSTALAANPTNCSAERYAGGINASGTAESCGPQTLYGSSTSICTTGGTAASSCSSNISWLNGTFADANYYAVCTGLNASGPIVVSLSITAKTTTYVGVTLVNGTASEANASTYTEVDCIGMHP